MSNVLTHRFVSPKLDGPDLTQVQPSAWNDGHRFQGGAAGDVLTRDPSDATFGATWAAPTGWVAFTPQWWLGGTLVVMWGGHHFESASYFRRGNAVWFQVMFVVGTEAIPAGAWQFNLPFPCVPLVSPGGGLLHTNVMAYPLFMSSLGLTDRYYLTHLQPDLSVAGISSTAPANLVAFPGTRIDMRGNYTAA